MEPSPLVSPAAAASGLWERWRCDGIAGLAVVVIMIPAVLAYAELVHLPPASGLYAALISMLAFTWLSSSRRVIVGPDAAIALLAGSAVAPLAHGDGARMAALAATLSVLAGIVLVVGARLRIGAIADLLSKPVLIGYLNGAALVLMASQIGSLLGLTLHHENVIPLAHEAISRIPDAHLPTLILGGILAMALVCLRLWLPRVPMALVGVVIGLGASWAFHLRSAGVAMIGTVTSGLPSIALPLVGWSDISSLMPAALGIAFLTFSDGILLARVFASRHDEEVDATRQLVALGITDIITGLFQGFPISSSQARTAVNDSAGARSRYSQLIAAVLLGLFMLCGERVLAELPVVALGAILIAVATELFDLKALVELARLDANACGLALATTAGVVLVGMVPGILLGVGMSLVTLVTHMARPRDAILRRPDGGTGFHDLGDEHTGEALPGLIIYRLYAPMIFANATHVVERIRYLVNHHDGPVRCLIIDAQAITSIDVTAAERLRDLDRELRRRGIDIKIARAKLPLRQALETFGLIDELGRGRFYDHVKQAVEAFLTDSPLPPHL
jgi:SulP family sulfate permease